MLLKIFFHQFVSLVQHKQSYRFRIKCTVFNELFHATCSNTSKQTNKQKLKYCTAMYVLHILASNTRRNTNNCFK